MNPRAAKLLHAGVSVVVVSITCGVLCVFWCKGAALVTRDHFREFVGA